MATAHHHWLLEGEGHGRDDQQQGRNQPQDAQGATDRPGQRIDLRQVEGFQEAEQVNQAVESHHQDKDHFCD